MKAKFNIDITVTNDCGSVVHLKMSSRGCNYLDYSTRMLEFNGKCVELSFEELGCILASKSCKNGKNSK